MELLNSAVSNVSVEGRTRDAGSFLDASYFSTFMTSNNTGLIYAKTKLAATSVCCGIWILGLHPSWVTSWEVRLTAWGCYSPQETRQLLWLGVLSPSFRQCASGAYSRLSLTSHHDLCSDESRLDQCVALCLEAVTSSKYCGKTVSWDQLLKSYDANSAAVTLASSSHRSSILTFTALHGLDQRILGTVFPCVSAQERRSF